MNTLRKPLCIDLFCGLFGWSEGFVQEGWDVIGFDLEDMHANLGLVRPPELRLVIQDVLTINGAQFRNADCIVASPPCQNYSWMAMPWSRAKAKAAAIRADTTGAELARLNRLFDACFRIQREACEAAGRHIPMVVENVRGAIPWVGRSRYNFGSYHLWGDVPALMPAPRQEGVKVPGLDWKPPNDPRHRVGQAFNPAAQGAAVREGRKVAGFRFDGSGRSFQSASVAETGVKCSLPWGDSFKVGFQQTAKLRMEADGGRKAASAMIAKIPLPLSTWIGRCFLPRASEAA